MKIEKQFLEAYDNYAAAILRHIQFRVSDQETAQDLAQEVFFKAWQYIVSGREVKNFKPFLYKIANNLIIDYYRQRPRADVPIEDINQKQISYGPEQEKEAEREISASLAHKYLSLLEDEQRQIVYHRYVDDLAIKEISEITGKTANNVRVIIHRALKSLKDYVGKN
ncbi:MAG: RNA polymerase sigma factor [Candidatus Terrybacteria bacterium]|nr:RNA polymerase sigma factor [Candidatus Terrybacteria bacterium]